jgi:hypothetical protein
MADSNPVCRCGFPIRIEGSQGVCSGCKGIYRVSRGQGKGLSCRKISGVPGMGQWHRVVPDGAGGVKTIYGGSRDG